MKISMKLFLAVAGLASLNSHNGLAAASSMSLRGGSISEERRLPQSDECLLHAVALLEIEPGSRPSDIVFECEMDPADAAGKSGQTLPIFAQSHQMATLKSMLDAGDLIPAVSTLQIGRGNVAVGRNVLFLEAGFDVKANVVKHGNSQGRGNRRLAIVKGQKPILAVKVFDVNGLARPETPAQMSDDIFGTGVAPYSSTTDPVNLASQLYACSMQELQVIPGASSFNEAPGVISVTIPVDIKTAATRADVRNAVTTAVQSKLGFTLPGPYQQVMYILQGCYNDCGWAAYAYVNSWNSVFQSNYYQQTGVQVHELGHNFNLAHSGGLDGQTYTDHMGMMGNPLYSDDVGKMCYNAAKNWQLDWYGGQGPSNRKILLDPLAGGKGWSSTHTMVGIADYLTPGSDSYPVVLKLETRTAADYFIGFNRATGVNSQNDEGDDEVSIVQVTDQNGVSYSQSYLRSRLLPGQKFTIANFGGTAESVSIEVISRNIAVSPGVATVKISVEGTQAPSPPPTANPTKQPTIQPTPAPTRNPTNFPTASPTLPGFCTDGSGRCSDAALGHPTTDLTGCACSTARRLQKGGKPPPPAPTTSSPTTPQTSSPTSKPTAPAPSSSPTTFSCGCSLTVSPTPSPTNVATSAPTKCVLKQLNESCSGSAECCSGVCSGGKTKTCK